MGESTSNLPQTPEVSVAILAKNAGALFRQTLERIFSQQTRHSFEVIVVDSGSTDETLEIANEFPVRKFAVPPQEFNFGLTRDYGFSLARGKYIVTLSQDAVPSDDQWLEHLIRPFLSNPNLVAVQGVQRPTGDRTGFYWASQFYFTSEARRWMTKHKVGLSFVNCAVRQAFWQTHHIGFTPYASDKKFQSLIHAAGGEIAVAKDAVCVHEHEYTFGSLVATLRNQGIGWKYAGNEYSLRDCVLDIIRNKWMLREAFAAWRRGEIMSWHEFLFLFLRPLCVYRGNRVKVHDSGK